MHPITEPLNGEKWRHYGGRRTLATHSIDPMRGRCIMGPDPPLSKTPPLHFDLCKDLPLMKTIGTGQSRRLKRASAYFIGQQKCEMCCIAGTQLFIDVDNNHAIGDHRHDGQDDVMTPPDWVWWIKADVSNSVSSAPRLRWLCPFHPHRKPGKPS